MLNHGRIKAYQAGCRCDECRSAKRHSQFTRIVSPVAAEMKDLVGTAWKQDAACRNQPVEWWFEGKPTDKTWKRAMQICAECPVRTRCLEWALQWPVHDLHGIWGGTSQRERVRITEQRKAPTCPVPITLRTTGRISGTIYRQH